MPSLLHRSSIFGSLSSFVPVKNHLARPSCSIFRHARGRVLRTHYMSVTIVAAALKTGSGGARGEGRMGYWLLKTEPGEWGWEHQERNGGISNWDGVRNALAQINLRSMREGDHAFFYHSGKGPAVVGVVEVVKAAYPDSSDESGKHCMVDVRALAAFPKPVPLSVIKNDGGMRDWILLRQSRLSVMPVSPVVWQRVCELGELSPPLCLTTTDDDAAVSTIKSTEPEKIQPKRRRSGEEKSGLTEAHIEAPLSKAGAQTTTITTKKKKKQQQETRVKVSNETEEEPKKRARRLPAKTKNGISAVGSVQENAKQEEQSTQSELVSVAELKTYQRSTRKRIGIVEAAVSAPRIPKTQKSRGVKKLSRDDVPT